MKTRDTFPLVSCALIALLSSGAAFPQDAAVANPTTVQVKLDNPTVRVLETNLDPGQKERLHSHPACVIYVIAGGKIRSHMADGTSVDAEVKTGATIYREPVTHWTENVGDTPIHLIITELKGQK